MERWLESHVCGAFSGGYILRFGLGQVTEMIEWNEERLKELVRKMGVQRTSGQGESPIHLSLYNSPYADAYPLLTQIMRLDAAAWSVLGYDETDRVSVVRYLGALGCRVADDSNWTVCV